MFKKESGAIRLTANLGETSNRPNLRVFRLSQTKSLAGGTAQPSTVLNRNFNGLVRSLRCWSTFIGPKIWRRSVVPIPIPLWQWNLEVHACNLVAEEWQGYGGEVISNPVKWGRLECYHQFQGWTMLKGYWDKSRWFPIAGTAWKPSLNPLRLRKTTPAYDVEQYTWNECARIPVQTPVPGPALFWSFRCFNLCRGTFAYNSHEHILKPLSNVLLWRQQYLGWGKHAKGLLQNLCCGRKVWGVDIKP